MEQKPTMYQLKKIAAQFGGKVEIDIYPDGGRALQIVAPEGKEWVDGNCVNMCEPFATYIKTGDGSKEAAIKQAIGRVQSGLEDYDEEING